MCEPPPPRVDRAARPYRPLRPGVGALHPVDQAAAQLVHAGRDLGGRGRRRFLLQLHDGLLDRLEPRAGSLRTRTRRPVARPCEPATPQLLFGTRQRHVQEPALLLDGGRRLGRRDRHEALAETEYQDRRPLQALGGGESGQDHPGPLRARGRRLARWNVVSAPRSRSEGAGARGPSAASSGSRRSFSGRRSLAGPRSAPATRLGTRAASMAAWTVASWALVRASTAMLDQSRPGARDSLAREAAQAASSWSVSCRTTWGTGPSTRVVRGGTTSPDPPSRKTAVATATTCGVQRWFSSRRMTLVPRRISGNRSRSVGSAPLKP